MEEIVWYIANGEETPIGPLPLRDVDVRFRTGQLSSSNFAWSEQIGGDWKPISDIPQLREVLQESITEVTPDILNTMPTSEPKEKESKESKQTETEQECEDHDLGDKAAGLAYFNPQEKVYKVFDVITSTWKSQQEKPSEEQLDQLQALRAENQDLEMKDQENEQIDDKKEEEKEQIVDEEELKRREMRKQKKKRAQLNKKKRWVEAKFNTSIYVTGLPKDIKEDELAEFAKKCGMLRLDSNTGQQKIKIYKDKDSNEAKGDASISYANIESVEMAIEWLNESHIRSGFPIHVEKANFEQKGEEYKPKEITKVDKIEQARIKAKQERQNAWDEDDEHDIGLKIVVLEHFYTLEEVGQSMEAYAGIKDPVGKFFKELEGELRSEIQTKVGPIEKVEFYKENPCCKIKFASALHAEECVKLMHNRFFSYRQLKCYFWDGKVDFKKVRESKEVTEQRIEQFGDWLDGQDLPEELQPLTDQEIHVKKRDAKASEKQNIKEVNPIAIQDLSEEDNQSI